MTEQAASTTSKVEVRWLQDDAFLGNDRDGHSVVFDSHLSSPSRTRTAPKGMDPMSALLASLGACSGMDVAAILLKRRQKLDSLRIEVSGKRAQYGYPKPFTEVHMKYLLGGTAIEEDAVRKAVTDSIERFCSVAATINARARVSYSYEIARP